MNYNNPYEQQSGYESVYDPGARLARAALTMGILAMVFAVIFPVYLPMILGIISIILAILSKGRNLHMTGKAKAGTIIAIGALVLNILVCAVSVYSVFHNPALRAQFEKSYKQAYEQVYGTPFEGFDFGEGGSF